MVRSAKDKRFMEMRSTVDEIKNKIKINDWLSLQTLFDKLNKQLEKVMRTQEGSSIPKFYFRALANLEAGSRRRHGSIPPRSYRAVNIAARPSDSSVSSL